VQVTENAAGCGRIGVAAIGPLLWEMLNQEWCKRKAAGGEAMTGTRQQKHEKNGSGRRKSDWSEKQRGEREEEDDGADVGLVGRKGKEREVQFDCNGPSQRGPCGIGWGPWMC
jgi:hypothetical protein